jgi:Tol biopolymer transport system component
VGLFEGAPARRGAFPDTAQEALMTRRLELGVLALLGLGFLAAPAEAQYFGRNPVQWERLDFKVLKTGHFDVYYYPEEATAAEQAGRMAERWYERFSRILRHEFKDRQPLILYASHPHFEQTNTLGGAPGEGTGGVTEAFKRRIVLPVGASLAETDHVLGHELVHAFQYDMTGQGRISSTNYPSALNMPLWFIEGMAEYMSVGPVDAHTSMWLRDAARQEKLPSIHDLTNPKYFPYRYGQALWAYLAGRYGDRILGDALRAVGPRTNDAEFVLKEITKVDAKELSDQWHAAIREAAASVTAGTQLAEHYGPSVVTEKKQGGSLNVGPALSPDGSQLAFLSERDLFSVELFLADARSGKIEQRLSHTAVDPHLESLQFINSAGSWDPSGKRLALGAVSKGRPQLVILEAQTGKRLQEIPFPDLGEIYTPSFSPDGRSVVFSALANGFTDLFVCDLEARSLRRLTRDEYADLQPAWSPDGKEIAFVTDRFSTHLDSLDEGNYRLAAVDVQSGDVRPLPGFDHGKHIDPQWSPDGRSLYFLSDTTGVTNVYRARLDTGELRQLTDLATGVSGITPLSPALTSAASRDKLAYSVYGEGRYEIYSIEGADRLAGWPVGPPDLEHDAALIPGAKAVGSVLAAKADAETGLTTADTFQKAPYKPKLGLDYVGQPYLAGGYDRYGAVFGGGVSMSFSDMLGEHSLDTVFQAEHVTGFTDIGAIASYTNRAHRLDWGVQIGQVPYITGGFAAGVGVSDGQPVYEEQTLLQRITDRMGSVTAYYPFNPSLRVELQAGYRSIGFDSKLQTDRYDLRTGNFLGTENQDLPSSDALHLFQGSAALVRDTSLFGATSPILGQRFRLEATPVAGSINYTGALADLRQYFMPVRPVTLAFRLMHYGRYGSGGEDPRMYPLFVGYPSLVRGYDIGSFSAAECGVTTDGSCPVYDQLLGSRMLVANAEVRLPLFALFGAKNLYGPLPVEIGGFFDSGVAWDSLSKPTFFGGDRKMVQSVGATARVNLLGFAVLQIDYAKPLDRPGKKPYFEFNLLAGF